MPLRSNGRLKAPAWQERAPVRAELFGVERLEDHGRSLAQAQQIEPGILRSRQLLTRLDDNADALKQTYGETARRWSRNDRSHRLRNG